jgi:excisionase family DNA binding protein
MSYLNRDVKPFASGDRSRLLTLEEAAEHLQLSAGTLRHWVSMKKIEHIKVGRLTRFTRAALDRYIARQTIAAVGDK